MILCSFASETVMPRFPRDLRMERTVLSNLCSVATTPMKLRLARTFQAKSSSFLFRTRPHIPVDVGWDAICDKGPIVRLS